MIEIKNVRSGTPPILVDEVSSPTTVYIRSNLKETNVYYNGTEIKEYIYDEIQFSREEYRDYEMKNLKKEVSDLKNIISNLNDLLNSKITIEESME